MFGRPRCYEKVIEGIKKTREDQCICEVQGLCCRGGLYRSRNMQCGSLESECRLMQIPNDLVI